MPVQIDQNNISVPGQVAITGIPTSDLHAVRRGELSVFKAIVLALDLNAAAPIDLSTVDPSISGEYLVDRVIAVHPTANLATAQLGLYTSSGAGGTGIVTPAALTGLTGVDTFHELTVAANGPFTAAALYPRLTVAAGTAGTCSLIVFLINIDDA